MWQNSKPNDSSNALIEAIIGLEDQLRKADAKIGEVTIVASREQERGRSLETKVASLEQSFLRLETKLIENHDSISGHLKQLEQQLDSFCGTKGYLSEMSQNIGSVVASLDKHKEVARTELERLKIDHATCKRDIADINKQVDALQDDSKQSKMDQIAAENKRYQDLGWSMVKEAGKIFLIIVITSLATILLRGQTEKIDQEDGRVGKSPSLYARQFP